MRWPTHLGTSCLANQRLRLGKREQPRMRKNHACSCKRPIGPDHTLLMPYELPSQDSNRQLSMGRGSAAHRHEGAASASASGLCCRASVAGWKHAGARRRCGRDRAMGVGRAASSSVCRRRPARAGWCHVGNPSRKDGAVRRPGGKPLLHSTLRDPELVECLGGRSSLVVGEIHSSLRTRSPALC
jgi:hypothetical protein